MKKRLSKLLLAVATVAFASALAVPAMAFADGAVAFIDADKNGEQGEGEFSGSLAETLKRVGEGDVVINLVADATLDYDARDTYGTAGTTSLTINGNSHTLTLNQVNSDWSSFGLKNGEAKIVMNDMTIEKTGYGDTSGAWNTHAIHFTNHLEMKDVTVNNSVCVEAGAALNNVVINETNGYYGLWIEGNGQTVTVKDGEINATNGGRGIKIADQYVDSPEKVTLTVEGTDFNTAKKAAVLVSSTAGAKVTANDVDITNVAEDSSSFVWVDEDWAGYYNNVKVDGEATKAQENEEGFAIVVYKSNAQGTIRAYFNTLDELFAAKSTQIPLSDNYIELRENVVAENRVNVSYSNNYYYNFGTSVEDGVTMTFKYADNWNLLPHFGLGEGVTMNVPYLQVIGGDIEIAGTLNTDYLYLYGTGEGVTITETGVVNANVSNDKTVQVKGGTVLTVKGELNTSTLNVWTQDVNNSELIVTGNNAKVNASHLHAWNGGDDVSAQKVVIENGATLTATNFQADRGSEVAVGAATLTADSLTLGYGDNVGILSALEGSNVSVAGTLKVSQKSLLKADASSSIVAGYLSGEGDINVDATDFNGTSAALIKANTGGDDGIEAYTGTASVTVGEGLILNKATVNGASVYSIVEAGVFGNTTALFENGGILDQGEKVRITVNLTDASGVGSLKVELYDTEGSLLTTVTPKNGAATVLPGGEGDTTVGIMILGESSSWQQTAWTPSVAQLPDSLKLYINGIHVATSDVRGDVVTGAGHSLTQAEWNALLGKHFPVATIGETGYATLDLAIEASTAGETITLLEDATIESGSYVASFAVAQGVKLTIKGGTFANDPSEFVAPGYYAAYDPATGAYAVRPIPYIPPAEPECTDDAACNVFNDVDAKAWYHEVIDWAVENDILRGYDDGSGNLGPEDATLRTHVAVMMWRMAGEPAATADPGFKDVKPGAWYYDAVAWAKEAGLLVGYQDGSNLFGSADPMTREQMAVTLWRFAQMLGIDVSVGEDTNILSYHDFDEISEYAIPAMQWAVGASIVGGYTDEAGEPTGFLGPKDDAERAHFAAMLMRMDEAYGIL